MFSFSLLLLWWKWNLQCLHHDTHQYKCHLVIHSYYQIAWCFLYKPNTIGYLKVLKYVFSSHKIYDFLFLLFSSSGAKALLWSIPPNKHTKTTFSPSLWHIRSSQQVVGFNFFLRVYSLFPELLFHISHLSSSSILPIIIYQYNVVFYYIWVLHLIHSST